MAGNPARGSGPARGQWGTLLLTTAATATLLGFQAFLTCTGSGARPPGAARRPIGSPPAASRAAPRGPRQPAPAEASSAAPPGPAPAAAPGRPPGRPAIEGTPTAAVVAFPPILAPVRAPAPAPAEAPRAAPAAVPARLAPAPPTSPDPAWRAADEAYRLERAGDLVGAARALDQARALGYRPQAAALDRAALARAMGDGPVERRLLALAAAGPDAALASRAQAELAALPRRLRLDLYSEVFAWDRLAGADRSGATVPMVRLRALWQPWLDHALDLYAFAQATREAGPIVVREGAPVLHADDASFAGGGVLLRGLDGHAGVFAQAGPAIPTAPGRAGRVSLDVRAGTFLDLNAGRCWPAPAAGVRAALDPCAEGYGEVTYVSRLHDDVFGLGRLRGGLTLLVAGPVALGLVSEGRLAASTGRGWYDQLVDAGAGLRARLLAPFHLELSATAVAGRYLGLGARDPAPPRLSYVDLRVQAATFVEF